MLVVTKGDTCFNKPASQVGPTTQVCVSMYNLFLITRRNLKCQLYSLKKLFWKFLENSWKNIRDRAHISIFASLQVAEYSEYRISSKKHRTSNKRYTFGYPHWNKPFPVIKAAPLNVALIRIVTMFYR